MTIEIIQSEVVFRGKVFDIRQDQIRFPDGKRTKIDIVEHSGAVTILPIDETGSIWFIRQYRHPAGKELFELPAGVMNEGEDPAESAQRELREEIGMAANQLRLLGEFFLAPGYSTEYMYVYLATDLRVAPLQADDDESIQIEKIPIEQVSTIVRSGRIQDAKSLAALFLWQNR